VGTLKKTDFLLVGADGEFCDSIRQLPAVENRLKMVHEFSKFPEEVAVLRQLRLTNVRLIVLDAREVQRAAALAASIEVHDPYVQVIAVGENCSGTVPVALMRAGVREFLTMPLPSGEMTAALDRRIAVLAKLPESATNSSSKCYSFLPAKPGAGASTIAANTAAVLASMHEKKTLLADLDFNSGVIGFRHRLDHPHTVITVLDRVQQLDEELWASVVSKVGELDVLASRPGPGGAVDSHLPQKLLNFLKGMYEYAIFDLSGQFEPHTFSVMQECQTTYLVCTQELDCLHVARAKMEVLKRYDLADRVRVLLNRYDPKSTLGLAEVSEILGTDVYMSFPGDYKAATKSVSEAKPIADTTALGKQFQAFAGQIDKRIEKKKPRKRYLEMFALPARQYWSSMTARADD
jgi:pilus assembly protein CpaE